MSQAEVAAGSQVVALLEGAALGLPSFVTFAGLDEVGRVVVAGDPDNRKITTSADLDWARERGA